MSCCVTYILNNIYVCLCIWEAEKENFQLLVQSTPKPRTMKTVQVSHMQSSNLLSPCLSCSLPGCITKEVQRNQDWDSGIPAGGVHISISISSLKLNACLCNGRKYQIVYIFTFKLVDSQNSVRGPSVPGPSFR